MSKSAYSKTGMQISGGVNECMTQNERVWVCLNTGMHLGMRFPCLYICGLSEYQTTIVKLHKTLSTSLKETLKTYLNCSQVQIF